MNILIMKLYINYILFSLVIGSREIEMFDNVSVDGGLDCQRVVSESLLALV